MMWAAIGGLVLVLGAWAASVAIAYRLGGDDREETLRAAQAERRALRRTEARLLERAGKGVCTDAWPDEWEERLASTGELAMAAETGDIAELERNNAAFMRVFDLWQWTARKRTAA